MQRHRLIVPALIAFIIICTVTLALGQARYTGTPADTMRVRVVNSGHTEAVPVILQEMAKVEVGNKPTVVLDPTTVVRARIEPRTWEYKLIYVQPDRVDEGARALNADGAQGWEATGVVLTSPTGPAILLKRPR